MSDECRSSDREGPWNPGINSNLNRQLMALSSIFRQANVQNSLSQALELHSVTGLPLENLAVFRPERLALHEIVVRVTADYEVPDPDNASIRSLGINLRQMTQTIISQCFNQCHAELYKIYGELRGQVESIISKELSSFEIPAAELSEQSDRSMRGFRKWFPKPKPPEKPPSLGSEWDREERILCDLTARAHASEKAVYRAALSSLAKVAAAVRLRHGRIIGRHTFLGPLATDLACNEYGADLLAHFLDPQICLIAKKEGFRRLPAQAHPVAMVTKGASASGKSTMRPLQRILAGKMGLHWSDFALISPDTWRRVLLDFDSLGPLYKYAGMLTSQEVTIVDRKLDAHLVRKGETRQSSHLLVDRFRFDSFALDSDESRHLASRFVEVLCYFFMLTPPELTVERAWNRGLELGRYKAVDDILAHNVEAYSGMQDILFGRALDSRMRVHYEFLDNEVPFGEAPLSVAFGWSGEMIIFDIKRMLDMERFRKININAQGLEDVYPERALMNAENNSGFLVRCVRRFPKLSFADRKSGCIYAEFAQGCLDWIDADAFTRTVVGPGMKALFYELAPNLEKKLSRRHANHCRFIEPELYHTIGRWA